MGSAFHMLFQKHSEPPVLSTPTSTRLLGYDKALLVSFLSHNIVHQCVAPVPLLMVLAPSVNMANLNTKLLSWFL